MKKPDSFQPLSLFTMFAPITKFESQPDGSMIVTGLATTETVDAQGEIVDFEASEKAFSEWPGNIREMHQEIAVGKKLDVLIDRKTRQVGVRAKISAGAKDTQEKVKDGTLTGYSIGGTVNPGGRVAQKLDDGTDVVRLKDYKLVELSLVDRPANPDSTISVVKRNVATEILAKENDMPPKEEPTEEEAVETKVKPYEKVNEQSIEMLGQLKDSLVGAVAMIGTIMDQYQIMSETEGRRETAATDAAAKPAEEPVKSLSLKVGEESMSSIITKSLSEGLAGFKGELEAIRKKVETIERRPVRDIPVSNANAVAKSLGDAEPAAPGDVSVVEAALAAIKDPGERDRARQAALLSMMPGRKRAPAPPAR
jgi:phage head maturation protease